MRPHALLMGLAILTATATTGSAQGYDWGGGTCIGHGCLDGRYDGPPPRGYRTVRTYEEQEYRPSRRVYERRIDRTDLDDDWDDDDLD